MSAVVRIGAVMFVLALIALAATEFQRQMFARTTAAVESEMGLAITLKNAHLDLNEIAGPVIYRYGGEAQVPAAEAAYEEARAAMAAALARAQATFDRPDTAPLIASTLSSWRTFETGMSRAMHRTPGQIQRDVTALTRGTDPYAASVWAPLTELDQSISELGSHSINDLRVRSDNAARAQRIVVPVVAAMLALGLWLIWLAARGLNRRVITPLRTLRDSTLIHDPSMATVEIDLRGTTVELEDLSRAMNDAALRLRSSSGALKQQADTDGLTGLRNRRSFLEEFDALLRETDDVAAVLFIDLDDFKLANDKLGHAAGDEVLRIVAQRLVACVRSTDMLARFGGDEFAITVGRAGGGPIAEEVARRVVASLRQPINVDGTPIQLGCSIGIAIADGKAPADADELVRNADYAMYLAKAEGKNRFLLFAQGMRSDMVSRTHLSNDVRLAVGLGQFEVMYQPAIDLESETLLGYEALLRWHHPTRGDVPPTEFIPLAESTGDIIEIGEWVLDQSCRFLAEERSRPALAKAPWISVNVSPLQIDAGFVATVLTTLRRHGLPPDALILEITEDVAVTNTASATAVLEELRGHGIRVALDDFGTGFSSLRYLHELPVDILKIDQSFVTRTGPQSDVLLEAITTLARRLGLSVVAEGVEKRSESKRLLLFAPMAAQGYLFARPMPAAQALAFGHPPRAQLRLDDRSAVESGH